MSGSPYRFGFEPLFLVLALVAVVAYVCAVRRAARSERPSRRRLWAFGAGIALVVVPLNSPLETLSAHYLLLMHLLQNALIADWGPPLLILGLTPAMRSRLGELAGRPLRVLTRPVVALPIWLVVWYGVHVPPFYDWALRDGWPLNIEHLLLLLAGLLFWWPVFERPRRIESLGILAYLGLGFLSAPWLSLAYIFSSRPFYSFYEHAPRLWGLSAVKDQNLAGILMNADQTSIFFAAFAWYLLRVLAEEEDEQRRKDAIFLQSYVERVEPPPDRPESSGSRAGSRPHRAPSAPGDGLGAAQCGKGPPASATRIPTPAASSRVVTTPRRSSEQHERGGAGDRELPRLAEGAGQRDSRAEDRADRRRPSPVEEGLGASRSSASCSKRPPPSRTNASDGPKATAVARSAPPTPAAA